MAGYRKDNLRIRDNTIYIRKPVNTTKKKLTPKPGIDTIKAYQGGKPIEEVKRELGISDIIKLASNENPLGAPPAALLAIKESATKVNLYPDGNAYYLKADLAKHLGITEDHLILTNGSNEVLTLVGETYLGPGDEVIYSEGAFVVYGLVAKVAGATSVVVPMQNDTHHLSSMAAAITDKTKVLFIANPNNPTGTMVTAAETAQFMAMVPENVLVIFDEAYYEYVTHPDYPQTLPYVMEERNFIITRTFSKIYGLAGLRVGYGIAPPSIISTMNAVRQPFNCNAIAQAAARAALKDIDYVKVSKELNEVGKSFLYNAFDKLGLRYIKSEGNFIMVFVNQTGAKLAEAMMKQGVIVREMKDYGYPNAIRVTIGKPNQNERFIEVLTSLV